MLTLKQIYDNKAAIIAGLEKKHFANAAETIEQVIALDTERKAAQQKKDAASAEMNKISKSIGALMAQGKREEAEAAKAQTGALKQAIPGFEQEMAKAEEALTSLLLTIPNVPYDLVPQGGSAEDNLVVKIGNWENKPMLDKLAAEGTIAIRDWDNATDEQLANNDKLPHWELAKKYNLIDFDLGVKISGAGFPVYTGMGARLQRALINFFLAEANKAGYTEIMPPTVVNEASGYGTGQLPDKEGQMYHAQLDNFYLIPTAEVPVTNIYRNVILKESDFPIKHCAYSACFRREAGSYGKDVRGLNRLHQFDKVEIVQIVHPQNSYNVLEEMKDYVSSLLDALELPYRIVKLCGGDISFTSALTFDFEVFAKGQAKWLEVSSVSNFESFQANRMKLRFKSEGAKSQLAHTLNGSALALPRILASLIENHQTKEGNIIIPKVLQPYTGFEII